MTAAAEESGIYSSCDVEKGIVTVVAEIAATPDRVFRAVSDPMEIPKWWGSDGVYRTEKCDIDLRPGGKWKCYIAAGQGAAMDVGGEYITVDPPRVLEFTWSPSWDDYEVSTVRYEIELTATGSRLTVTHSGFEGRPERAKGHREGWVRVLAWLSDYAEITRLPASP